MLKSGVELESLDETQLARGVDSSDQEQPSLIKTLRSRRRQRGNAMLGVLLAAVIAAVITVVIFEQYNESTRKARVQEAAGDVTQIIQSAQSLYGLSNQLGSISTTIAIQSGVIPAKLRVPTTNTARNKYGGDVSIAPVTLITNDNSGAEITYAGVPKSDCAELVMAVSRLTRRIQIGTNNLQPLDSAVDLTTTATQCDAAATSTLKFAFGRQAA